MSRKTSALIGPIWAVYRVRSEFFNRIQRLRSFDLQDSAPGSRRSTSEFSACEAVRLNEWLGPLCSPVGHPLESRPASRLQVNDPNRLGFSCRRGRTLSSHHWLFQVGLRLDFWRNASRLREGQFRAGRHLRSPRPEYSTREASHLGGLRREGQSPRSERPTDSRR